jgi:hypothetical protein
MNVLAGFTLGMTLFTFPVFSSGLSSKGTSLVVLTPVTKIQMVIPTLES